MTALVALLGLGLAAYIVGPQLYWHAAEVLTAAAACPACDCNCDARPLLDLPEGAPPPPSLPPQILALRSFFLDPTDAIGSCPSLCFCAALVCTASSAYAAAAIYELELGFAVRKTYILYSQWMILRFGIWVMVTRRSDSDICDQPAYPCPPFLVSQAILACLLKFQEKNILVL